MQNAAIALRRSKKGLSPASVIKKRRKDPEDVRTPKAKKAEYDRGRRERVSFLKKVRYAERKQDPEYRILHAVKSRTRSLRRLFQLGRIPRVERTRFLDYFGAEPSIVLAHIESQFTDGMTWENYGKAWHLDHIIPICRGAGNIDLLTKLNHYKNLRPLSPLENHRKRDKMPDFFPEGVPFTPEGVGWLPPKARQPTVVAVQVAAGVSGAVG